MMQDSESDDFSDSDYEEVDIGNSGTGTLKIIVTREYSFTTGTASISPSPLRLTSWPFPDVIPATEKINQIQRDSDLCSHVKKIPEVSQ
ncbi:hypothetical protein TNCV_3037621 [Trichonephila clavipes]|nr:hypothetical protein TNCV_3037621 [Trichonephila clavipes]